MAEFRASSSQKSQYYTGILTVNEVATDIANNTSTLEWSLVLNGTNGYYFEGWNVEAWVDIDGQRLAEVSQKMSMTGSGSTHSLTIWSGQTTVVRHNTDGTKAVQCAAYIKTSTAQSYLPGEVNITGGTLTLTTLPRASSLTIPQLTVGDTSTIGITRYGSNFKDTVTYNFGGLTGTLATKTTLTSLTFDVPSSFLAKMPDTATKEITFTVQTFNGTATVGTQTFKGTVTVPSSIRPSVPVITIEPVNTSAWLIEKGYYVGGQTKVKVTATAEPGTSSTLDYFILSGADSGTFASTITTRTLEAGTQRISVTAVDKRGRTRTNTVTVDFAEYKVPSISATVERGSGVAWVASRIGAQIRVQAEATTSLTGNSGSFYITCTDQVSRTIEGLTADVKFTSTLAASSYTVEIRFTDSVGNSVKKTYYVPAANTPFDINTHLPGVGAGVASTEENVFEIASDWKLKVGGVYLNDATNAGKFLKQTADGLEWAEGGGGTVTDEHINELIDAKLGVIENGSY